MLSIDLEELRTILNNREWAALFWLIALFTWALSKQNARSSFSSFIRSLFSFPILATLLAMVGYVALEVRIGYKLSIWNCGLLKETIIWVIVSGLAMFLRYDKAAEGFQFFRKQAVAAVGGMVFVEFFMNLMVFHFFGELLLQPFLTILILISFIAGQNIVHRPVKKLIDGLLAIIGISLLLVIIQKLFSTWDKIDKQMALLQLALPIWLTIGILPAVYMFCLYVNYDSAFKGINHATSDWKARMRAKSALVTKLHFRTIDTSAFSWNWSRRIASASNFAAACSGVDEFRESRRVAKQAVIDEQERLKRHAGSEATDERGRRLDRREFKETIKALRWLSTCQMGWYRKHQGRYQADLLERLGNDFTRQGLPADSGITMKVSKDGQAWFAWRRTVTGWCFAIGASGPPPEQWEYDGPEPPIDFPGKGSSWGKGPFSDDVNLNWKS